MKKNTVPSQASSRFARALERQIQAYVHEHNLLHHGERVIVGVSGGPDSVMLLLCLAHLQEALGVELAVAHFDHQLRGTAERKADADFVRLLATGLCLPLSLGSGDVKAYAKEKRLSMEEAARGLRYRFFADEAARLGAGMVAVGHTADDQAETVLLHLLRGSGTDGLAGMRPKDLLPIAGSDVSLVRPLLKTSRKDTERYCVEEGIEPRFDTTNLYQAYRRNRIRHELLPLLRNYNSRIDNALLRLAEAVANDVDYLESVVDDLWQRLAFMEAGRVQLPKLDLIELPVALQTRLLRRAAQHLTGAPSALSYANVRALLAAARKGRSAILHMPFGLRAEVEGDHVALTKGLASKQAPSLPLTKLNVPGETALPNWKASTSIVKTAEVAFSEDPYEAFLDLNATGSDLWVRCRKPGDRFRPLGMVEEKKLQDFFVDAKVSRRQRDAVPLVCTPWGIAWVVGHRVDDRAKVTDKTRQALYIKFSREGETT